MKFDEKILGDRIKKARESKGLSQAQLAKALGIGQRGISELENGNRKLAITELPILADTLEVHFLYFIEGSLLEQNELDQLLMFYFNAIPSDDLKKSVIEITRILSESKF